MRRAAVQAAERLAELLSAVILMRARDGFEIFRIKKINVKFLHADYFLVT